MGYKDKKKSVGGSTSSLPHLHLQRGIGHVPIERVHGPFYAPVGELQQVLVYAAPCEGHHPVTPHVVNTFRQVTHLDHDYVGLARLNAEVFEIAFVVVGFALLSYNHIHATGFDNHLCICVAFPNEFNRSA